MPEEGLLAKLARLQANGGPTIRNMGEAAGVPLPPANQGPPAPPSPSLVSALMKNPSLRGLGEAAGVPMAIGAGAGGSGPAPEAPPPPGKTSDERGQAFMAGLRNGAQAAGLGSLLKNHLDYLEATHAPSQDMMNEAKATLAEKEARRLNAEAKAKEEDKAEPDAPEPEAKKASGGGGGGPAIPQDPGPSSLEKWRVGPSVRAAFQGADDATQDAIETRRRGESLANDATDEYLSSFAKEQAARVGGMKRAERDRGAQLQAYRDKYDSWVEDIGKEKIDNKRFWANKSTPEKIGYGISVALQGFASGAQGRSNDGIAMMQRDIAADVEEQKANYEIKAKKGEGLKTAYGMALSQFGDERAAEQAIYAASLDRANTEMKRLAGLTRDADIQAKAAEASANFEQQKAQRLNSMTAYLLAPSGGGGGGAAPKLPEFEQQKAYNFGGHTYLAGDAQEAKEIRAGIRGAYELQAAADRIEEARKAVGTWDFAADKFGYTTPAMAKLKSEGEAYTMAVKGTLGSGLASEGDYERVKNITGSGASYNDSAMEAIRATADRTRKAIENRIQDSDHQEVATGYAKNKQGFRERVAVPTGRSSGEMAGGPAATPEPKSFKK